jgi:hypothetical protein
MITARIKLIGTKNNRPEMPSTKKLPAPKKHGREYLALLKRNVSPARILFKMSALKSSLSIDGMEYG